MGKRSDFDKIDKDFYPTTDVRAVVPLVKFIRGATYAEPCYGNGDLEDLLMETATCRWSSDIRDTGFCRVKDAMDLTKGDLVGIDLIVTNPPFTKNILLPLINHFITLKPTWLLLPADLMHNVYFSPYIGRCQKVVSVGRLKWFKDSKHASTDNFAWYFWPQHAKDETTAFFGRT